MWSASAEPMPWALGVSSVLFTRGASARGTGGRLSASPLRVPQIAIRKRYQAEFLFFFCAFFFFFCGSGAFAAVFFARKVRNTYFFPGFDAQVPLNGSENGWKERNTGRRITVLLSYCLGTGHLPRAEGREFASAGLQRYDRTSFLYHFDGSDIYRYSFRDFFLHFPPVPYGIRAFQLKRRAVRPVNFRDFYRDFAVGRGQGA